MLWQNNGVKEPAKRAEGDGMGILYQVFCPMCGVNHSNRVDHDMTPGRKGQVINRRNFWTGMADFDPQHPFGFIQESIGRGSFRVIREFAPNEDPSGSFPLVKARMLAAVKEWIEKGWLDKGEVEGTLGISTQGPPLGPYSPAVVVETPRPPKRPVTYYPTYIAGEEIPPTAKPPAKKKAPPKKKEKPAPIEEIKAPPPPKVKRVKPPKPAPKPVEEEVVKRRRPEFRGEPIMARLPSGKYYYTDQFGKFIPPDRWKDVDVLKYIEPGPNALTQREYDAYVAELRAKEEAVKEEFAARVAAEAAAKKAEAEAIRKAEADARAAAKKEKPARKKKAPAEEVPEIIPEEEEELPPAVGAIPEVGFPPTTTDELQDYLFKEWDESFMGSSVTSLKARIRKLLTVIGKDRFEGLDELQGKIQEYEEIKGRTAGAREEREGTFAEVQDALGDVAFVEEAEEVEVTARVAPGTLVSVIPAGENMMTLSAAFKALQAMGVLKEWSTPAQRAVEEAKFRDILSIELENRQLSGGAGAAGNLPENRRLRVGEITGYIKRP